MTSDGQLFVTSVPSDVLAALFNTLHETLHREGVTSGLNASEQALYDAVVAELTKRAQDVKR